MNKKFLRCLVYFMLPIILCGCSKSNASFGEELKGYPSTVQDGTISKVFYDEYVSFVEKSEEFSMRASDELKFNTTSAEKRFIEVMNEYHEYLEATTYTPTTMADTEIFDAFKKYIDGQKFINTSLFLYTATSDKDFQNSFGELLEDAKSKNEIEREDLDKVLIKYNLK